MLSNLGWRSLENRRTDTRYVLQDRLWPSCHTTSVIFWASWSIHLPHALSFLQTDSHITDRFTHLSVTINTHFFLFPLFFGTSYQLISSWFLILTPLKQESARSIIHTLKRILFLICFNSILLTPNTIIFISSDYHSFTFTLNTVFNLSY